MNFRSLLLGLLFIGVGFGTTLRVLPFNELVQKSDLIVSGTILKSETQFLNGHIWTRYSLRILETLKGSHQELLEFEQPGGVVGKYQTLVSGTAELKPDSSVCLFLWLDSNGAYQILGLEQGHFPLISFGEETLVPLASRQLRNLETKVRHSYLKYGLNTEVDQLREFLARPTWTRFKGLVRTYDH